MANTYYTKARTELISILRKKGITDEQVISAINSVPRHEFVQSSLVHRAYEDVALPIGQAQTISQPYTVAIMSQSLRAKPGFKILEIGTGSGYQAAVLKALGCQVFSIERHLDLMNKARTTLERLGYGIACRCADGTLGWNQYAPFDGIIVTAGGPTVPPSLTRQLKVGARLVIPIGDDKVQNLHVITRLSEEEFQTETIEGFKFVPLIGKEGWVS
ncbi:MAG: protein-L-isoaspartate(D-aspartate) O-methyltransferase [Bacteroidetes bacterium]|nr:protein-L-isoaspartate(D-aspartate) O-methyltransferase [Bacteroidota bacterium]